MWSITAICALGIVTVGFGSVARAQSGGSSIEAATLPTRAQPEAVQLQSSEYVIPELIVGGEWTSTIRFTNRGTSLFPRTNVFLIDNNGNPLRATFQITNGSVLTDSFFSITLGVGAMVEATFIGGSDTAFGHAIIACSSAGCSTPGIYGEVTLRNHNATRPDFESVFPFERPASLQYMLFDGRNGVTTTLYLVNENTTFSQIAIDVVDTNNRLLRTVTLPFAGLASQILTLHALAPETIGVQGTLVIHGQNSTGGLFVTATGLRVNPTNSFTPLRAFVPGP